MTFRKSARRSQAIGTKFTSSDHSRVPDPACRSERTPWRGSKRSGDGARQHQGVLKPIARGTYGPHPLRTAGAVVSGSIAALVTTFLLAQSSVVAQISPASIRTAASSGSPSKPGIRVEANRLSNGPAFLATTAVAQVSSLATTAAGTVRANAALPQTTISKAAGAVLATGAGPLDSNADVASVQLASIIEGMPEGDLGPLVLASGAITLSARSRDDIANSQVDQRILAMLLAVSFDHEIEVTVLRSGHSKYVRGTKRLSNHVLGRAVDIGAVDGRLVRQSNKGARSIVDQLLALPGPIRPTEIGSPWNTDAPETFTDSGHDDHLHIGFDS